MSAVYTRRNSRREHTMYTVNCEDEPRNPLTRLKKPTHGRKVARRERARALSTRRHISRQTKREGVLGPLASSVFWAESKGFKDSRRSSRSLHMVCSPRLSF